MVYLSVNFHAFKLMTTIECHTESLNASNANSWDKGHSAIQRGSTSSPTPKSADVKKQDND